MDWDGEERRKEHCSFHISHGEQIIKLEEGHNEMMKKLGKMSKYVFTGVGIVLCGALIVTILFTQMGQLKADMTADMVQHETMIDRDQDRISEELKEVGKTVDQLGKNTAVLSVQMSDLVRLIEKQQEHTDKSMNDIKEIMRDHLDRQHNVP